MEVYDIFKRDDKKFYFSVTGIYFHIENIIYLNMIYNTYE